MLSHVGPQQVQLADIPTNLGGEQFQLLTMSMIQFLLNMLGALLFFNSLLYQLINQLMFGGTLRQCILSKEYPTTISNWIYPTSSAPCASLLVLKNLCFFFLGWARSKVF